MTVGTGDIKSLRNTSEVCLAFRDLTRVTSLAEVIRMPVLSSAWVGLRVRLSLTLALRNGRAYPFIASLPVHRLRRTGFEPVLAGFHPCRVSTRLANTTEPYYPFPAESNHRLVLGCSSAVFLLETRTRTEPTSVVLQQGIYNSATFIRVYVRHFIGVSDG